MTRLCCSPENTLNNFSVTFHKLKNPLSNCIVILRYLKFLDFKDCETYTLKHAQTKHCSYNNTKAQDI